MHQNGLSIEDIVRLTGTDESTVREIIDGEEPLPAPKPAPPKSLAEPSSPPYRRCKPPRRKSER